MKFSNSAPPLQILKLLCVLLTILCGERFITVDFKMVENTDGTPPVPTPYVPMINVSPPSPFKGNSTDIAGELKMFKTMFENYSTIAHLDKRTEKYYEAVLLQNMGPKGIELYNGLSFSETENKYDVESIIKKMDEGISGETDIKYERCLLNNRSKKTEKHLMISYLVCEKWLSEWWTGERENCGWCQR